MHVLDGIHRSLLPVSNTTDRNCGGVPNSNENNKNNVDTRNDDDTYSYHSDIFIVVVI